MDYEGAALHCWTEVQKAIVEISRILKPGGIFVGTTVCKLDISERLFYRSGTPFSEIFLGRDNGIKYRSIKEIEDFFKIAGLKIIDISKKRQFVLFSARKPF